MNHHTFLQLGTSNHPKTKIISVGSFLPENIVKSDDLFNEIDSDTKYGIAIDWMSSDMGIVERRMAPSDTKPSDLAIPAARKAIDSCSDMNPDEIGLVIFCGIERDQSEPATAHTIQHALGLKADHAFDVSNACYGFLHGIEVASLYINSGAVKYALVVTGEVPTRVLRASMERLKSGVSQERASALIGALSVGDAGGAVLLGRSSDYENIGFELFNTRSDSSHIDKCYYKVGEHGDIEGQMKMGPIVGASIWMHRKIIDETLQKLGWDKFDWVLSHQTGRRPFEKFSQFSTVSHEKMIRTYPMLGNIASATFPINYEMLINNGKVKAGDRIGGIHSGSGLVIGEFGYQM